MAVDKQVQLAAHTEVEQVLGKQVVLAERVAWEEELGFQSLQNHPPVEVEVQRRILLHIHYFEIDHRLP